MDGPEADSIWQAYQFETENDNEEDVEEMEAELLGDQDWYILFDLHIDFTCYNVDTRMFQS